MKRIFLILGLLSSLSYTLEKKIVTCKILPKAIPCMISSSQVHEMMANRQIAPQIAWMILLGNFPEDYTNFVTNSRK